MKIGPIFLLWIFLQASKSSILAISDQTESQRSATLEIEKVTGWTKTDNVVGFIVTGLASQVIISLGWIISGKTI